MQGSALPSAFRVPSGFSAGAVVHAWVAQQKLPTPRTTHIVAYVPMSFVVRAAATQDPIDPSAIRPEIPTMRAPLLTVTTGC